MNYKNQAKDEIEAEEQSEINKTSGGKLKPSYESLINSGESQKNIVGKVFNSNIW